MVPSYDLSRATQLLQSNPLSAEEREKLVISLAEEMLSAANATMTSQEKQRQQELARMMRDPKGKAFTTAMTDRCFRSQKHARVANELVYLIDLLGIPKYLSCIKRLQLGAFYLFGKMLSFAFVPLVKYMLRSSTSHVIVPGEREALFRHIALRYNQGVHLNLNHLGEAILSEQEALRRLNTYLEDLKKKEIEYISIKISTIYSQIQLLSWEHTLEILTDRLRQLYRAAQESTFQKRDGTESSKFVNLDMEEYKDLDLTKELFKKVLSEPEFFHFSAGIVLQAYLPDSFEIQKELTQWAIERVANGGAPIKIRIVKGANLAMEQVESSLRGWEQAPYCTKAEVDASYKRMVTYGSLPPHARAVYLGIASHNLFDIAYALVLRTENRIEESVSFEMLEGMAEPMRRVVQKLSGGILLYCPIAAKEDFQSAIAYLIRRLDENTGPGHFLRAAFDLKTGSAEWNTQVELFTTACRHMHQVSQKPRRTQNRLHPPRRLSWRTPFENEPDTDFSLPHNRHFAYLVQERWKTIKMPPIPLVIEGKDHHEASPGGKGYSPNDLTSHFYDYSLANWEQIDAAIACAKRNEAQWSTMPLEKRCDMIAEVAHKMRERRGDLIGVMIADGGKTIIEGDSEISEAIDFAEYYIRSLIEIGSHADIHWRSKGTVLVTPPWNFPVSIPAGGILAALITGNCVLFKPAPEAVLCGWILVNLFWEAGVPREVLQFINCVDDPIGSRLVSDPRVDSVCLTGATSTARLFLQMRPDLDLHAETGGKNAMIVTEMADRDLAIKDLIHSAFGHSGQKCSACSLAILEAEVYDDPKFRKQLKEATESLQMGSSWDPANKVIPLIHAPNETLKRGLTSLEKGEQWLVQPQPHPKHPNWWTPGIKWGVKEGSFMHTTELFGPVLAVLRANSLSHAIEIANATAYGLTSGLHSLDEREHTIWLEKIEAGNCYINRSTTGAVVRRQPFGGTKSSSFGSGAKAGGPNYLLGFLSPEEIGLPTKENPIPKDLLNTLFLSSKPSDKNLETWNSSISSYATWRMRYAQDEDPSRVLGQDNFLRYKPHKRFCLRIETHHSPIDIFRCLSILVLCRMSATVSFQPSNPHLDSLRCLDKALDFRIESHEKFADRISTTALRVRLLSPPTELLSQAAATSGSYLVSHPVLSNGRFELLHYLREIAISQDYHRYGNLGLREEEPRR